ncbi:spore germination protein [Sporosarcina thermotolerans]|uniref:Spore germination protein n=1 Tax=Sporosarcina thermotolerans TaxID=633404 RepID=A0AAW9A8F3_9BACL|nr:spore germination protein [Sporosarcina thermotolerans]MDW0117916.1 spore germination protein [Sporosarcina thermotolerans]WHT49286.1 spore germination protein [Sporosarcina thermotolerans]
MNEKPGTTGAPKTPPIVNTLSKMFNPSGDVVQTPLQMKGECAFLFYLRSVADGDKIHQTVIRPFFEMASEESFTSYIHSLPNRTDVPDKDKLLTKISSGCVLIIIRDQTFLLDIRLIKNNEVQDTTIEPTVLGPQKGLSEDIGTTINLIRQRYHKSSLKVEEIVTDDQSKRAVALLYDIDLVDQEVLKKLKEQIKDLQTPLLQSAGELQHFLNKSRWTLFPTTLVTERPDRIVYNLVGGKVIIAIDGSPNVIIAPVIFFDFMSSMEDNYHVSLLSTMTILLRYIGLFICILLPGLYVAMTSYNPNILRIELALTVAGSRIGVPYPSFIEVFFMLLFMELLTEASMRLPKAVSGTATTVGGLILGTAATEAALTSTIMIIIISAMAIATFVIPVNEMSFTMRVVRVLLLIYSSLFGMVGLLIGFLGIIMLLVNKESLGVPYLRIPWIGKNDELKAGNK